MDRVVFRMIRGEVNAFLPDSESNKYLITCYAHMGQHSEASLDYYTEGRLATPEEYKDLYQELTNIGYNLRVIKRIKRDTINWPRTS